MESKYAGLEAAAELVTQLKGITGDKELLNTTDKSTLVAAVNELFDAIFDVTITHIYAGEDWQSSNFTDIATQVNFIEANNTVVAFGFTNAGIKYSTDNGVTWQASNITTGQYLHVFRASNGTLITSDAYNNRNIKYSTDNGVTWQTSINSTYLHVAYFIETDTHVLVASGSPLYGIVYSTDSGVTWQYSNVTRSTYNFVKTANNTLIAASISSSGSIADTGIKYSTDNGVTWQDSNITSGAYTVSVTSNNVLIACCYRSTGGATTGIKYSTDNGVTWQDSNITSGTYNTYSPYNHVFEASDGTLLVDNLYSTDNGATWQAGVNSVEATTFCEASDGTLLVGSVSANEGILYSIDKGATWQLSNFTDAIRDIIVTDAASNRLVASGAGAKYSTDNGVTWQDSNHTVGFIYNMIKLSNGALLFSCDSSGSGNNGIKYSVAEDIRTLKPKWETAIETLAAQLNS